MVERGVDVGGCWPNEKIRWTHSHTGEGNEQAKAEKKSRKRKK